MMRVDTAIVILVYFVLLTPFHFTIHSIYDEYENESGGYCVIHAKMQCSVLVLRLQPLVQRRKLLLLWPCGAC